jgi:hypothetical protein
MGDLLGVLVILGIPICCFIIAVIVFIQSRKIYKMQQEIAKDITEIKNHIKGLK